MSRMRLQTLAAFCLAVTATAPAFADDGVDWTLQKKSGQPYLVGMLSGDETDTVLWANCGKGGAVEIGVGAEPSVGNGDGEKVSLTLKSADRTATLTGTSRKSKDSEMTGGTELRAKITRDDPLFAVLATGKPVTVTGDIKTPGTWPVKGLRTKVAAFLAACR